LATLATNRVAWPRATDLLRDDLASDEAFNRSRERRRADLLVHLALLQFPGAPKYRTLPKSIQADIKAFFRSNTAAQKEGRRLLFAAGDRAAVKSNIETAINSKLGGLRGDRWFRFRASTLPQLPSLLRVLVGCAEVLQGGVDACDFVDVDIEAPRISMVICDDIEQMIPFVIESVTVDLARLKVSANKFEAYTVPLYFKSRFLSPDDDLYDGQVEHEKALKGTGLFQPGTPEPAWIKVRSALDRGVWSRCLSKS
jgi:DNA phosphorothioation-associated putative methyltransferase